MSCRALTPLVLLLCACGRGSTGAGGTPPPPASGGGPTCGAVRLTSYLGSDVGYCEFDRTLPILPASVRAGLTLAMAQPWLGGSYGGEPGEACGECWEVSTLSATKIIMVDNECPSNGMGGACDGDSFHFDLESKAAAALGHSGLEAGSTRRVACPVTGNVFLSLLDRNQWGFLRFTPVNHRVPVRQIDYRAVGTSGWKPARRDAGAWAIAGDGSTFAQGGPGGVFRITSAQGQVLEMPNALGYAVAKGSTFDLGAQLTDLEPSTGPACNFEPPADVYVDGYGGIPNVRWRLNPWPGVGGASEVTAGCVSGSCIRVSGMDMWSGFNIYYVQSFAPSTFASLSLKVKSETGTGTVDVWVGDCAHVTVPVSATWTTGTVDLASACAGKGALSTVSVQDTSGNGMTLLLDDVRFAH